MLGLALDSAGPIASAALWRHCTGDEAKEGSGGEQKPFELLAYQALSPDLGKADQLILVVEQILVTCSGEYQDLDVIAVSRGPGSFTGIRSAVALGRGLALAIECPVVGVTSQEALAAEIGQDSGDQQRSLMIAKDARRGQVYCQSFTSDLTPLSDPRAETPDVIAEQLSVGRWRLAGSGASLVCDRMSQTSDVIRIDGTSLTAKGVAIAASNRFARGETPIAGFDLLPLYIRPPDAARPRPLFSSRTVNTGA